MGTTRRQLFVTSVPTHHTNSATGTGTGTGTGTTRGCAIIDTPGLRELQLIDASEGLNRVFPEFVELSQQCRFTDCQHTGETPGCAINAALDRGDLDIDEERFLRWDKLMAENTRNTQEIQEQRNKRRDREVTQKKKKKKDNHHNHKKKRKAPQQRQT